MAFLKKETLENGAVANFWVMTNLKIDFLNNKVIAYYEQWVDEKAFGKGMNPIGHKTVILTDFDSLLIEEFKHNLPNRDMAYKMTQGLDPFFQKIEDDLGSTYEDNLRGRK